MGNNESVKQWEEKLHTRHMAHSRSYSYYKTMDRIIGLSSALLSTAVATTVFASFANSENSILIIIAGSISVLATLFTAGNSFLKFGELAERHNQAAASFGQLRRQFEILMNLKITDQEFNKQLEIINSNWSELEQKIPALPQWIFDKSDKIVKSQA